MCGKLRLGILFGILQLSTLFRNVNGTQWIPDIFQYSLQTTEPSYQTWLSTLNVVSNGIFYTNDGGNFRFLLTANTDDYHSYLGATDCIPLGGNQNDFLNGIQNMRFIKKHFLDTNIANATSLLSTWSQIYCKNHSLYIPLSSIFSTSTQQYSNVVGNTFTSTFETTFSSNTASSNIISFQLTMEFSQCSPVRTIGYWNDNRRWDTGIVPTSSDPVVIPIGSGVIYMV